MRKVPTKRITFTTMQALDDTLPGEKYRLLIAPQAQSLFNAVINDQALTTGDGADSGAATATATATAAASAAASTAPTASASSGTTGRSALAPADIAVHVANGTTNDNRATDVRQALISAGYASDSTVDSPPSTHIATTTLTYGPGRQADAQEVARSLGLPGSALKQGTAGGIHLLIGADWPSGTAFPGGKASAPPADTKVALTNANAQTGDKTDTCAPVGTYRTVKLPGHGAVTPTQAYSLSPDVPDSAP